MPVDYLARAHAQWADGNAKGAIAAGWDAANDAMVTGDREALEQIAHLATGIANATDNKLSEEATRLASYCRLSLDGVGTGVQASSVVGRLIGRRKTRKCPDCAEKISIEARVCPHCGYRFATEQPST